MKKEQKNVILTGDRPTGKLHIGHLVGSLKERVRLQNETEYDDLYIMIADAQALTDNAGTPQKVRDNIIEIMFDYLAVGLDPMKSTFFVQSCIPALPELTAYYMNLVTLPRLLRNPTVKSEIQSRGYDNDNGVPVGFANYPISQAADITAFKANIIPVGIDQEPMLEQTREIARSFNKTYCCDSPVLVECKSALSDRAVCMRLPGTDGNAKMSKSIGNCIYLADSPEVIKSKINSIKTFPRAINEPGILENNVLFIYLDAFCQDKHFELYYPEFKNMDELKKAYSKGGIGDGTIKKFLNNIIQSELRPIRERREKWVRRVPEIYEIIRLGTVKANNAADKTLEEVKKAMGINYFTDDNFLNEQVRRYSSL